MGFEQIYERSIFSSLKVGRGGAGLAIIRGAITINFSVRRTESSPKTIQILRREEKNKQESMTGNLMNVGKSLLLEFFGMFMVLCVNF